MAANLLTEPLRKGRVVIEDLARAARAPAARAVIQAVQTQSRSRLTWRFGVQGQPNVPRFVRFRCGCRFSANCRRGLSAGVSPGHGSNFPIRAAILVLQFCTGGCISIRYTRSVMCNCIQFPSLSRRDRRRQQPAKSFFLAGARTRFRCCSHLSNEWPRHWEGTGYQLTDVHGRLVDDRRIPFELTDEDHIGFLRPAPRSRHEETLPRAFS